MRYYGIPLLSLVAALTACGGGGGSPGTSNFGSGTSQTASADPVIKSAVLLDSSGAATNSIAASGFTLLSVKLTDPKGNPIPNQVIDASADAAKVVFPEGPSGLTNSAGVATIKLARASLTANGAGSLTVTYSYKAGSFPKYPDGSAPPATDKVVSSYVGYQLAAANVTLANLDAGASTLAAYGTRPVSVQANLNGAPISTPVQVTFSASCGQISPTSASTNSNGVALVSYSATDPAGAAQSTQGCSGKTVQISASILGGSTLSTNLNIQSAPATNMSFVDASPVRIYLADSGGPTQSIVRFKLVNARGEPLLGQGVTLSLKTLNEGIPPKATLGTVGNTGPVTSTTDANGMVSVPVFSGTVPTNVLVNAALTSNPAVQTDSAVLAIASGRPAQSRVSVSLEKFAIEGLNIDGPDSKVTMSLADRQGNPVPDGTVVNFVTSGGVMIPPTCTTGATPGDSQCTVTIRAQNPRPAGGRVAILAYAAGEEDFVDANFNNVYDCGESFKDLGTAFRDDNFNSIFDTGEFSVPRAPSASSCGTAVTPSPAKGDGVWGVADVRGQILIVFASSEAIIDGVFNGTTFTTTVRDVNGNSMPTGSQIVISANDTTNDLNVCRITSDSSLKIPNTLGPTEFPVVFSGCFTGDVLTVKVTTPLNFVTTRNFTVPANP